MASSAPWTTTVDGNDNVWIPNFSSCVGWNRRAVRLSHRALPARREDGSKLFRLPVAMSAADCSCRLTSELAPQEMSGSRTTGRTTTDAFGKVDEALQTQGAGQGVVVFYGMAKPVKTPLIGPPRQP